MSKICVIKAGSAVVTQKNGLLDFNVIGDLCRQIAVVHEHGWQPVLVTSGAVASGRSFLLGQAGRTNKVEVSSRSYAALGQCRLLAFYTDMLDSHNVPLRSAQILLTREAFSERERYSALRDTLKEMLAADILPIINNNDVINVQRLDFSDNDHLAAYVAGMLDSDILVLLSDIDGVYLDSPKTNPDAVKIQRLQGDTETWPKIKIDDTKSSAGGMRSKLAALKLMASLGIGCCIARGRDENVLHKILLDEDYSIGTYLEPRGEAPMDNYKRWLATGALPVGTIVVSNLGSDALRRGERRASLLAAGIEAVYGDFDRDAIVAVRDENFNLLGIGRAKHSAADLRTDERRVPDTIVVHADYFMQVHEGLFSGTEKSIIELTAARLKSQGYSWPGMRPDKSIVIIKAESNASSSARSVHLELTGDKARDCYTQARKAAAAIEVEVGDWILYAILERRTIPQSNANISDAASS